MDCSLGMALNKDNNMDNQSGARVVDGLIQKYGCLPTLPDGPVLSEFSADKLADAIMQEVERGGNYGFTKITIHLDLPDAVKLAQYLRR